MAVNVKSVFLGSKYATAQMLKQDKSEGGDRGWIINMSSIYGVVGGRYIGMKALALAISMADCFFVVRRLGEHLIIR